MASGYNSATIFPAIPPGIAGLPTLSASALGWFLKRQLVGGPQHGFNFLGTETQTAQQADFFQLLDVRVLKIAVSIFIRWDGDEPCSSYQLMAFLVRPVA